jgi:hypothetical protein
VSDEAGNLPAVVDAAAPVTIPKLQSSVAVPAIIAGAGDHAARRFLEFFAAQTLCRSLQSGTLAWV